MTLVFLKLVFVKQFSDFSYTSCIFDSIKNSEFKLKMINISITIYETSYYKLLQTVQSQSLSKL